MQIGKEFFTLFGGDPKIFICGLIMLFFVITVICRMLVNGIDTPDDKHSKHSKYTNLIDENNQLIEYMCLSKKPFAFDIDRVGKDGHTTIFTGTVFRGSIWPPKRVKVPMLDGSTEEVLIEWITSGDVAKEGDKCSLMTMTEINIDEIKIGGCLTEKEE